MTTPANPDDLITWLRAIYDERERTALAAGGRGPTGQWHTPDGDMWAGRVEDAAGNIVVYDEGSPTEAQAAHIADNDPADELRDLDAKRRILDLHPHRRFAALPEEWPDHWKAEIKQAFPGSEQPYVGCEVDDFNRDYEVVEPGWWCQTVRLLALPFAARDGYRSEWAPA